MMMGLPAKHLKSSRGQILLIFLLVLVVGSAIVLSVASRTITDIKTTTTSDESNRAYFAAEAGIEEALRSLHSGNLDFSNVNATATVTVGSGSGTDTFFYPSNVVKDDVVQLVLLKDFDNLNDDSWGTTTWGGGTHLNFYWGAAAQDPAHPEVTPAIEVSVIYATNAGTAALPNWVIQQGNISKMTFDPNSTRGNNFCADLTPGTYNLTSQGETKTFYFRASVNVFNSSETCGPLPDGSNGGLKLTSAAVTKPVLARIRLLYNPVASPLAVESVPAGVPLPSQGKVIESTGQTTSGVTRKLQVIRLYPALSALFDYVLFNGSTGGCPGPTDPCPLKK